MTWLFVGLAAFFFFSMVAGILKMLAGLLQAVFGSILLLLSGDWDGECAGLAFLVLLFVGGTVFWIMCDEYGWLWYAK
jgi:hypothetical protein